MVAMLRNGSPRTNAGMVAATQPIAAATEHSIGATGRHSSSSRPSAASRPVSAATGGETLIMAEARLSAIRAVSGKGGSGLPQDKGSIHYRARILTDALAC